MNNGADLTVLVPLWRRTINITRVYDSAVAATPDVQVLFVASELDYPVVDALLDGRYEHVSMPGPGGGPGDYARKINHGYRASDRPCLFTGADDIVFDLGWYDAARALLDVPEPAVQVLGGGATITGPFNMLTSHVGVVGTNDQCNARTFVPDLPEYPHSTHSLIGRWYADQGASWDGPNVIYHEGYEHEYCDDELVATARLRGSYAHALDSIVRHLHPNTALAPDDETYQRGRSRTRYSRRTFLARQRLWGGQRTR